MQTIWLRDDISMMPRSMGVSSFSGELVLTMVNSEGSRFELLGRDAAGDAGDLDAVAECARCPANRHETACR